MKNRKFGKYISPFVVKEIKKINTKAMSILDVGCGSGEYMPYFKGEKVGIDYDATILKEVRKKYPTIKFIRHDCTRLPLPIKRKFDLVFSIELIEHLPKKYAIKLIDEFEKSSKGYVFISTPNVNNFTSLLRFILFRNISIAGKANTMERFLYKIKYHTSAPKRNKYPVVDEALLSDNPQKQLHYHVSSFNSGYFRARGYKVVGGLGFVSYHAIGNKYFRNFIENFFYYFPYFAGDILAIKKFS